MKASQYIRGRSGLTVDYILKALNMSLNDCNTLDGKMRDKKWNEKHQGISFFASFKKLKKMILEFFASLKSKKLKKNMD